MSRRELLNVAWKLGAGRDRPAARVESRARAADLRAYPFTLGVASGDPLPDGVVLWTRLAPEPLEGGGMPMANVEVGWEVAARRGVPDHRAERHRDGAARARAQRARRRRPASQPGREYWYRFRAGSEVSQIGRTRHRAGRRAPPSIGCASPSCGCSHYEIGYFTAFRQHRRRAIRFRLPHRRLHLRGARRRRPQPGARAASTTVRRSTRSSTIAIATRSTSPIPI